MFTHLTSANPGAVAKGTDDALVLGATISAILAKEFPQLAAKLPVIKDGAVVLADAADGAAKVAGDIVTGDVAAAPADALAGLQTAKAAAEAFLAAMKGLPNG
ncbi:MAG TPA: hypothetical protein VGG48_19055 [Rhizomicrobium sp.]|jgi:hypothetical protein